MKRSCITVLCIAALLSGRYADALPTDMVQPQRLSERTIAAIDQAVRERAREASAPAISVAVAKDGSIVYERATGYSNFELRKTATSQTPFSVGSITKMFTAAAIMQLAQNHRLSLDNRLGRYVPYLPSIGKITLRQLLTHTSGLHDYLPDAFTTGAVVHATTPQAIAQSIAAAKPDFAPGERYGYSNSNYVLLGLVVESVASLPLDDYIRRHIFVPAGMKASGFSIHHDPQTAVGYLSRFGPPVKPYDASWLYADGNIVSTAADIARFDIALMNGTLVRPNTLVEMESERVLTHRGGRSYYGLGLSIMSVGGKLIVGHHGGVPGFEGDNELLPHDRFAVVVLGNAFDFMTAPITNDILAIEYPQSIGAAMPHPEPSAAPAATEDRALTERFTSIIAGLRDGVVPAQGLTPQLQSGLSPALIANLRDHITALGPSSLRYEGRHDDDGGYVTYVYNLVGTAATATASFTLDKQGMVAGLHF